MRTQVYLVPGFFGFASLGGLNYFLGVRDALERLLGERGIEAEVVDCRTQPTGSLRKRASALLEQVIAHGGHEADHICFVGHSTGGLDVRLLLAPGLELTGSAEERAVVERTRAAVFVCAPHFGTPLANYFITAQGRTLLQLLTSLALTRGGRLGLFGAAKLASLTARLDDFVGRRETMLDYVSEKVFRYVSTDRDDQMWGFLRDVSSDQGRLSSSCRRASIT